MNQSLSSHKLALRLVALVVAMMAICSCDDATVYAKYRHTRLDGWERTDSLIYDIPPMKQAGDYMEDLGMRINDSYPFLKLCIVIEQTVIPSHTMRTDTVVLNAFEPSGMPRGHGVNDYQYSIPIGSIRLAEGDSLHVVVHHNMRRESIPGISDVGIKLSKLGYRRQRY